MNNDKTIEVLNTLVQINNDRIDGYETALKETQEHDLKILIEAQIKTSQNCLKGLSTEVTHLGGEPTDGTKLSGKFFRVWMDVKAALTGKDRKAILNSCEYGEGWATDTYESALKDQSENLTAHQQTMIKAQHALLMVDQNKVKAMLDILEKAA